MGTKVIHSASTRREAVDRVQAGESRRAVARALGVSDATVGRWCNIAAEEKLDTIADSPGEAAQKGWAARRADIAETWEHLATACQEMALRALQIDVNASADPDDPVLRKLRLLGGSAPLKAILTSAAIATDKALLMANEVTARSATVVSGEGSAFQAGINRLEHILDERGPRVDDPIADRLFDELEEHLLRA